MCIWILWKTFQQQVGNFHLNRDTCAYSEPLVINSAP